MLKVLQFKTQEHLSGKKDNSNSVNSDRSKIANMKFPQNSISAQTLLKRFVFQVKHF